MVKGSLILLVVFVIVGILHFTILKLINAPEHKKQKIRKVFWYVYGFVFSTSGIVNLLEEQSFHFVFVAQLAFGVGIIILNFLGKMETRE